MQCSAVRAAIPNIPPHFYCVIGKFITITEVVSKLESGAVQTQPSTRAPAYMGKMAYLLIKEEKWIDLGPVAPTKPKFKYHLNPEIIVN